MIIDLESKLRAQLEAVRGTLDLMVGRPTKVDIPVIYAPSNLDSVNVDIYTNDDQPRDWVTHFAMTQLPDYPWLIISNGAWVDAKYQGRGIGSLMYLALRCLCEAENMHGHPTKKLGEDI